MLTLLYGPDRVELTGEIFREINEAAVCGEQGQVLIVPDQFSHEAERRLCTVGGDTISRYAEVLSLSRLSDRLASIYGGAARAYLDKGGQMLSMALAAEQISSRIKYFAAVLRKPEFLVDLVRIVGEFESYCLKPDMLLEASKQVDGQFSMKLEELGLLYEAYMAVCSNVAADPADKLERLCSDLAEHDWADGRTVYVDGFSDFTGAELRVLDRLICCCRRVIMTVPGGPAGSLLERKAEEQMLLLRHLAQQVECPVFASFVPYGNSRNERITKFAERLFRSSPVEAEVYDAVSLITYQSVEEECQGAVLRVKELLSQGAMCRDISVACSDLARYEASLRAAFRTADLPIYFAGEVDILSHPTVGAILNSLFAAIGAMEYEDVSLYLKSGLPCFDRDRCDRLDNYAYLWNLRGTQWEKIWTLHPQGFAEVWTDSDREILCQLNADKDIVLKPLLSLRKSMQQAADTGEMVLAVYEFLETLDIRKRLENRANDYAANGNGQSAHELLQIYDTLITALEQIWVTIGKTRRTAEDFGRLYQILLTRYRVATIPAGLDQVHISDLPDLRHRHTKHLLVLGADDGYFPAYKTGEGLLTEEERKQLSNHGLSMAPSRADQIDLEVAKIYHALVAAQTSIRISCSGEQPSWLFQRAVSLTTDSVQAGERNICLDLSALAATRLRERDETVLAVPHLREVEDALRKKSEYVFDPLEEGTVRSLYGSPVMLSPSKIDQYAACRFGYFMNYGLKAKPRKQASLDQPAFGTFVHAVMEHTVEQVRDLGGFRVVEKDRVLQIATDEICRYAEEFFPEQAERETYLFRRSQTEVLEIVEDIWEELRNSLFQPEYCELQFAKDGMLPLISIQAKNTDCLITGTIDRVDLYETRDRTYVRVVDYKTGRKEFDYTDILNGAGLQMLVYLFALREFGGEYLNLGQLEPAGVLYLPARKEYPLTEPMPEDVVVAKEHQEKRKRKGLIRCEEHLLAAMEADPYSPRYMPYKYGKNGFSGDLADQRQMILLERHVLRSVENMADQMIGGSVVPNPVVRGQHTPCRYCDYKTVCHKDMGTQEPKVLAETPAKMFWEKLEQEELANG